MPSEFATFAAEFASPALLEQFADRDEHGEAAAIAYYPPSPSNPIELPAIIGQTRFENDYDPDRDALQRRELIEVVVERSAMRAKGIDGYQKTARVEVRGKAYILDEATSKYGEVFATLGLVATPLVELGGRRGSV